MPHSNSEESPAFGRGESSMSLLALLLWLAYLCYGEQEKISVFFIHARQALLQLS